MADTHHAQLRTAIANRMEQEVVILLANPLTKDLSLDQKRVILRTAATSSVEIVYKVLVAFDDESLVDLPTVKYGASVCQFDQFSMIMDRSTMKKDEGVAKQLLVIACKYNQKDIVCYLWYRNWEQKCPYKPLEDAVSSGDGKMVQFLLNINIFNSRLGPLVEMRKKVPDSKRNITVPLDRVIERLKEKAT